MKKYQKWSQKERCNRVKSGKIRKKTHPKIDAKIDAGKSDFLIISPSSNIDPGWPNAINLLTILR